MEPPSIIRAPVAHRAIALTQGNRVSSTSPSPSPAPSDDDRPQSWSPSPARSTPTPSGGRLPALQWSGAMRAAMLEALVVKVVEDGLRADCGYKKEAWNYAVEKVEEVSWGQTVTVKAVKSKHDNAKADWKHWSALLKLSGFTVTENGIVVGDSEALHSYFKSNPRAKKFMTKPLEYEELHRQLFEGVLATGENALTIDTLVDDNLIDSIERTPSVTPSAIATPTCESSDSDEARKLYLRKRAVTATPLKDPRKKLTSTDRLGNQMGEIATQLAGLVDAMNRDYQREALQVFQTVGRGLDLRLQFVLMEVFENEFLCKLFVGLKPVEAQKQWIVAQLRKYKEKLIDLDNLEEQLSAFVGGGAQGEVGGESVAATIENNQGPASGEVLINKDGEMAPGRGSS